jgi:asparagine synthase (glutamine-hydrolysing)
VFALIVAPVDFRTEIKGLGEAIFSRDWTPDRCIRLYRDFLPKPVDDSFCKSTEDATILCEGILLSHKKSELEQILKDERHNDLARVHGQFGCLYIDHIARELRVYSNVCNNFRLYYYHANGVLIIATSIKVIVRILALNGIKCHPDEIALRMLLTYGYMLRDYCTISEIRHFSASNMLRYKEDKIWVEKYFRFKYKITNTSIKDCADEVLELFRMAVKQGFERDEQKKHLAFISGGLDSRLVVFTAYNLMYRDLTCLNFSQPGYLDQTIGREICSKLGYDFRFFSLEGGEYLKNLDENLIYNEGQTVLHGAAHLYAAIQSMPLKEYGILHSGQAGGIIKGAYLQSSKHSPVDFYSGAYSTRLIPTLLPFIKQYHNDYETHELFIMENRGFNALTNGDLACLPFSYTTSALLHPDLITYLLNIPPELRKDARTYLYLIKKYYPEAAKFKWEKYNCPINTPYYLAQLRYYTWRGTDKIKRMIAGKPNQLSMNPFDYWWQSNPSLRENLQQRFTPDESVLSRYSKDLQMDIHTMYRDGSFSEKCQAYTALRGTTYLLDED